MNKLIFLLLLLICAVGVSAQERNHAHFELPTWSMPQGGGQQGGYPAYRFRRLNSEPATCLPGDVYFNIGTAKNRQCLTNNTWSDFGSASGAGVTANPTVGTVPYLSAATVYSDSPITRLSATHLQVFAGGVGGADFDSSAPRVSLNNGRYLDDGTDITANAGGGNFYGQSVARAFLGDGVGNGNLTSIEIDDINKIIDIFSNGGAGRIRITGPSGDMTLTTSLLDINSLGGNNTSIGYDDSAKTITLTADATTGIIDLNASAVKVDNLTASLPVYTDASKNLVSVQPLIATTYLGADFTNATTTLNNTNLSASVISGSKYAFVLQLFVADSVAADGFKIDFNGGDATMTYFIAGSNTSLVTGTTSTLAGTFSAGTVTGTNLLTVSGSLQPSSTGTLIVRAAQSAHTAGTLTVSQGSSLVVTRR